VKRVILPDKNEKDLRDLPEHVKNALKFEFVSEIDELIRAVWGAGVIIPKPTTDRDDRGERRDEAVAVS
jgi:ATP-dependent Lon protease